MDNKMKASKNKFHTVSIPKKKSVSASQDLIITSKQIEEFMTELSSQEVIPMRDTITEMTRLFKGNRMNCQLYLLKSQEHLLIQLIQFYLRPSSLPSKDTDYSTRLLELIDIVYYYTGASYEVFEKVYQSLAQYFHKKDLKLTEGSLVHYLSLLKHIYGKPGLQLAPKNCFFFDGRGQLKVLIPQKREIALGEGFFLSTSFLMLRYPASDEAMIHLIKVTTDKIAFSLSVKKDNSLVLIVNDEIRNSICALKLNTWTCLSMSISNAFDRVITVKVNQEPLFSYKLNFINKKSYIHDLVLFDGLIGEATSVVMLNSPFQLQTSTNIFNNNQHGFFNKKAIKALFKEVPLEKCTAFLTPINPCEREHVIDDLIGLYRFELVEDVCLFRYKANWKTIDFALGINQLLPILELVHVNELCTEEVVVSFLEVVWTILKDSLQNQLHASETNFFELMSLFMERMPNDPFTLKLLQMLFKTASAINNTDLLFTFYRKLILNEIILFKFPLSLHHHVWTNLKESFTQDISLFLLNFPIAQLFTILLSYDANRFTEYCCQSHYNSLIHLPSESSSIMSPPLHERTRPFIELITDVINRIDISKSKSLSDLVSIFEFLSMDLSPCLTKTLLRLFINFFTHKDNFLRFKSNEITKKAKFYEILNNLLATSLTDIKCDILSLILISNKQEELEPIVINGLGQFLFPLEGWYKPKESGQLIQHRDEDLILNPDEYIKFKQNIHNILLQFLFNNVSSNLSVQYTIQPTVSIVNKGIIEVMIDYSEKNEKDGGLHLLKDFKEMFMLNLVNCSAVYAKEKLYMWLYRKMFEGFDSEKTNEKFLLAREVNNLIVINTIQNQKVKKVDGNPFSFKRYQSLFALGADMVSQGGDSKAINDFIRYVIEDQFEALKGQIMSTTKCKDDLFYQAAVSLFSLSIDYMTVFNLKPKSFFDSSFFFTSTKSFSSLLSKGLNMNPNPPSSKLKDIWADYALFSNFYSFFSPLWDKARIQKFESKQKSDLSTYNDSLMGNLLLNKNNQNMFLEQLATLDLCSDKENALFFGTNVIMCFALVLSIVRDEEETEKWFEEFKYFILFYIIGTSNAQPKSQELIQSSIARASNLIVFSLVFLTELSMVSTDKGRERAESVARSVFSLCCKIISSVNEDENAKFSLTKLWNNPIEALKSCCVVKAFKEIVVDINGGVLLTAARLSEIKRQHFSKITQTFQAEPWCQGLTANAKIQLRIDNMFSLASYLKKAQDKDKLAYSPNQSDKGSFCKTLTSQMKDIVLRKQREICTWSNGSYRSAQLKQASYAAVKKKMFLWKGLWANRSLFYDSIDTVKVKVMNHYSKAYVRPLLGAIADVDYYLPHFSGFNKDKLFQNAKDYRVAQMNINDILNRDTQIKPEAKEDSKNLIHYIYSNANPSLWKLYLKCNKQAFYSLPDDLIDLYFHKTEDKPFQLFPCCRIKISHHIKGMLVLDSLQMSFWVREDQIGSTSPQDLDNFKKSCFGSYFAYHNRDRENLFYAIPYSLIRFVFRRSYYYRSSALEMYLSNNKTVLFNFPTTQDRESALQSLINKLSPSAIKILSVSTSDSDQYNNIIGFEANYSCICPSNTTKKGNTTVNSIVEAWKRNELSNLELLMLLNIFGNRSFLNLTQYPVFPWLFINYSSDYISNEKDLRDLTLPVGMFSFNEISAKRKQSFLENYSTQIEDNMDVLYHYSSHYSNPIYVTHYLVRLFPYAHTAIELQGNSFDDPNRLFFSMDSSFVSVTTQKADVRELIPEFFCLPELLLNKNKLNMGKLSANSCVIEDVQCPEWCKGSAFYLIQKHREHLEDERTSRVLGKWIDLIFGKKQRGKEAEAANNLFSRQSYGIDIEGLTSEEKTVNMTMVEFGITPKQVLTDDFPIRNPIKANGLFSSLLKVIGRITLKRPQSARTQKLIGFELTKDGHFLTIFSDDEYYVYVNQGQPSINQLAPKDIQKGDAVSRKANFLCKLFDYYHSSSRPTKPWKYNKKHGKLVQGGFFDGKIIITSIDSLLKESIEVINMKKDNAVVTAIDIDNSYNFIFAGNSQGRISVLQYDPSTKKCTLLKSLIDGGSEITSLYHSSELNVLASVSRERYINLYTVPTFKLFRSIRLKESCDHLLISHSPVPCLCAISLKINAITIYSINGSLIKREVEDPHPIKSPKVVANSNFCEHLVYIIGNSIRIRTLPDFQIVNEAMVRTDCLLEFLNVSEEGLCYLINEEGNEINLLSY